MWSTIKIPPGIERNGTPYETPNAWYDCSQVRWQSGTMLPVGGWTRLTASPLNGVARSIEVWRTNTQDRRVLVGTDNKLYSDYSGIYNDVTPSGFTGFSGISPFGGYGTFDYGEQDYGDARSLPSPIYSPLAFWSFGHWGEDTILTANSDGRIFYFTSSTPTTAPTVIGAAPTGNNAVIVTPERHVMLIGSGGDGRKVSWSSREDYTDWNFASTTNTAGFLNLTSRTPLLKAFPVAEGTLVFSYTDVFLIQYMGQPYIYGGTAPISATSMFNPAGVATFNGKAVWLSRMGFQLYSGGVVQPLPCPILRDILADMDPTYGPFRMHASNNGLFPEIWFFYPSVGQTECDRYVIWSYAEGWWAWGALSRSAMSPADTFRYPYMGGTTGHMFQHEDGWLDNGATRVGQCWAETGALGKGGAETMEINQFELATGEGPQILTVTGYGRFAPEGTEYTFGPYTPRANGYTDARICAKDVRLKFTNAENGNFSLGTIRMDIAKGAGR